MEYILILTIHADPAMPPGYSEWGGTHTYMRELLDIFTNLNMNCVLITRRCMEELPAIENYSDYCTIYRLQNGDIAPIDKTKLYTYHDDNLTAIQQIIQEIGHLPTVIHSVYWNSGRLGVELAEKYNIPLVHSVISNSRGRQARGAYEPLPQRAGYEQLIYEYAKWILCVSEDEKNDLIKLYNIPSEKLIVAGQYIHSSFILPSRDNNGFPRLNSNISTKLQVSAANRFNNAFDEETTDSFWAYKAFTYFGRIDESKGVDHILTAWCSLYQKYEIFCPPLWLIGGSIEEINLMRTKLKTLLPGLVKAERENKIVWWGCIDPVGASTLLLKSLVLVTNSLYEPGGRVITEAMSEGIPVIAAPNGFALDLVIDWVNGFLVNHGDELGLMMRMEHFIRQPFLSNALGENARQTAIKVINEWDFVGKHLMAYEIETSPYEKNDIPFKDYFARREIHLFPYRNQPLSSNLLYKFVEECTGENAISCLIPSKVLGTSDIYYIQCPNNKYIIKRPYTRLALSPLVLPIQKMEYVRNACDFYRYETAAYESCQSDILVGKDDSHQLLLLRELESYTLLQENYPKVIEFLNNQRLSLSDDNALLYNDILSSSSIETVEDIDFFLNNLSLHFPDFYFEPTVAFCPYFGWKLATYILEYNNLLFDKQQSTFLYKICNSFSKMVELPYNTNWYEITSDISLHHIMLDKGKINYIDRERRTIGKIEYMIADFLLDILVNEIKSSSNEWLTLLNNKIPQNCDKKQIVESLSYKLFYRTILESVMHNDIMLPYLEALDILLAMEEKLWKY